MPKGGASAAEGKLEAVLLRAGLEMVLVKILAIAFVVVQLGWTSYLVDPKNSAAMQRGSEEVEASSDSDLGEQLVEWLALAHSDLIYLEKSLKAVHCRGTGP